MGFNFEMLSTPRTDLRALRWRCEGLYNEMKESYAIGRVEKGRSEWRCRGRSWTSAPGSLHIKRPGDVHRDLACDGPRTLLVVRLPTSLFENIAGRMPCYPESHLADGDPRSLPFHRLLDDLFSKQDPFALEVAVTEAVTALLRIDYGNCNYRLPIRRALEYLRNGFDRQLQLDELARHVGLDKYRLCKEFRHQVGLPPHAYLIRTRIVRAKHLLERGMKAKDVAAQVGFYDQAQFCRHFRQVLGLTPTAFARLYGCGHMPPNSLDGDVVDCSTLPKGIGGGLPQR